MHEASVRRAAEPQLQRRVSRVWSPDVDWLKRRRVGPVGGADQEARGSTGKWFFGLAAEGSFFRCGGVGGEEAHDDGALAESEVETASGAAVCPIIQPEAEAEGAGCARTQVGVEVSDHGAEASGSGAVHDVSDEDAHTQAEEEEEAIEDVRHSWLDGDPDPIEDVSDDVEDDGGAQAETSTMAGWATTLAVGGPAASLEAAASALVEVAPTEQPTELESENGNGVSIAQASAAWRPAWRAAVLGAAAAESKWGSGVTCSRTVSAHFL